MAGQGRGGTGPGRGGTGPGRRGTGPGTGGGRVHGDGRGRGGRMGGGRGMGARLHRRDGRCRPVTGEGAPPVATGPRLVAGPRLIAVVARPDDCTACELCVGACPRSAITVDDVASVDADRCDGCGECVTECPNDVFELRES